MSQIKQFFIHVTLSENIFDDHRNIIGNKILTTAKVIACTSACDNYDSALTAFNKIKKYDMSDNVKSNPVPIDEPYKESVPIEKNWSSISIWKLVAEAVQISLDVTRDMIKDHEDLDDVKHEVQNLTITLEIYDLLNNCADFSNIRWSLAQVSWLEFITGQHVMMNDESKELAKRYRTYNIYPSF